MAPYVDLSEPNAYGLRTATAHPALLAYYRLTGAYKVRQGDNPFGPVVKIGFRKGVKSSGRLARSTPNSSRRASSWGRSRPAR
jgi:hypothetical protein